jgi:hypothetical protein
MLYPFVKKLPPAQRTTGSHLAQGAAGSPLWIPHCSEKRSIPNARRRSGICPVVTSSAMIFPVTGLASKPMPPWPVATITFSQPGTRPRMGEPSADQGRRPVHIFTRATCSRAGARRKAPVSSAAMPPALRCLSKPTHSLVLPTQMVPSVLGIRPTPAPSPCFKSVADGPRERACFKGGSGCLSERICPLTGLTGRVTPSHCWQCTDQAPAAMTR